MKTADVQSSAARLKEGFETLNIRWDLSRDVWQDHARMNFEEHHLRPLEAPVMSSLEAIRRLGNTLARAQKDVSRGATAAMPEQTNKSKSMKDDAIQEITDAAGNGQSASEPANNGSDSQPASDTSPSPAPGSDNPFDWRQDEALRDLVDLAGDRGRVEKKIHDEFTSKSGVVERDYEESNTKVTEQYETEKAAALAEFNEAKQKITDEYESDYNQNEEQYTSVRNSAITEYEEAEETARKLHKETRWEANTVFEATKKGPAQRMAELKKRIDHHKAHFDEFENQARDLLVDYRMPNAMGEITEAEHEVGDEEDVFKTLKELVQEAHSHLLHLGDLGSAKMFVGAKWLWLFIVPWVLAAPGAAVWMGWQNWIWLAIPTGAAVVIGGLLFFILRLRAKKQVSEICDDLTACAAEGAYISRKCFEAAQERSKKEIAEIERRKVAQEQRADKQYEQTHKQITAKRDKILAAAREKHEPLRAKYKQRRDKEMAEVTKKRNKRTDANQQRFDKLHGEVENRYKTNKAKVDEWHEAVWSKMAERWTDGVTTFHSDREALAAVSDPLFPPFAPEDWKRWEDTKQDTPSD